jgi:hypothetical protein
VDERIYDIHITATDAAGNTGSDVCHIVVAPETDAMIATAERDLKINSGGEDYATELIARSATDDKFKAGSISLTWEVV